MIVIRKAGFAATWNGEQWSSDNSALAESLNAVRYASKGYLPNAVNVQSMVEAVFGIENSRYETLSGDAEPTEPGAIY